MLRNSLIALANIAGVEKEKFFALIKEQNKTKKWTISPIKLEVKDGEIIDNADQIKEIVEKIKNWKDEQLSIVNLTVEEVEDYIDTVSTVYTWISGTRKNATSAFDAIKKKFTATEKELKEVIDDLKAKREALKEEQYQKHEKVLREFLDTTLKELKGGEDIELQTTLFDDLISNMRKTQILTDKGSLKKSAKDKILSKISEIVEPIKAEREKQKIIQNELDRLEYDTRELMLFDIDSKEDMEAKKAELQKLYDNAPILYPNAQEEAKKALQSKINLIQKNLEVYEAKKDQRHDEELLNSLNRVIDESSIEDLEKALQECREAYPKAKLTSTKNKITTIAEELKSKIAELRAKEVRKAQPAYEVIIEPAPKQEEQKEKEAKEAQKATWLLDELELIDFNILIEHGVKAETEEEAKEVLTAKFSELVRNAKLIRKD